MSKKLVSDVLWEAANKHLWDGSFWSYIGNNDEEFSCNAAARALRYEIMDDARQSEKGRRVCDFLCSLGVDCGSDKQFAGFGSHVDTQGARYLWLMFAYLVALDEEKAGRL